MLSLSAPQDIYLNGLNTKFRAYVGGFGSGKTYVGCLDLLTFFSQHPKVTQGYFGPTYPSIRDIFYPTFEEAAEALGFRVMFKLGDKEADVYRNGKSETMSTLGQSSARQSNHLIKAPLRYGLHHAYINQSTELVNISLVSKPISKIG